MNQVKEEWDRNKIKDRDPLPLKIIKVKVIDT
jgi:hypothetical protein